MVSEDRRAGRTGIAVGFLLGLIVAGIPLVLLLLRPPPIVVVNAPPPVAAAPGVPGATADREEEKGSEKAPPLPKGSGKKREMAGGNGGGTESGGGGETEGTGEEDASTPDEMRDFERALEHEENLRKALRDTLKVRVVDSETGAPLPHVDLRLFVGTFQSGGCSSGQSTRKDGSADLDPMSMFTQVKGIRSGSGREPSRVPFGSVEDPLRADVTIRVPGYKPFRADATGDKLDVKLEKEGAPRPFGSLTGRLLDPEGVGWTKPVVVSLQDPVVVDSIKFWVLPGPDGRFELSGVPAGAWGVKVTDCWGPRERVEVPSGGAVEVTLHLNADDVADGDSLPETRRGVSVTVSGRDLPYGAAILLNGDWGSPVLAAAPGGTAYFAGVPVGAVRITLRRPDGGDESFTTVVAEGEGIQAVSFPAPK